MHSKSKPFLFLICLFFLLIPLSCFAGCCDPCCGPCEVNWSGFYVGLNSGYGWGNCDTKTTVPPEKNGYFDDSSITSIDQEGKITLHPSGYTGGVQAGYNITFCKRFLAGLETDFGAFLFSTSKSKTVAYPDPRFSPSAYTIDQKITTNWLFTLRPRLGYTCGKWLPYVTGGVTLTNLKYREIFSDDYASIFYPQFPNAFEESKKSRLVAGWAVGGGVEYAIQNCLSLSISYLYTEFGHLSSVGRLTALDTAKATLDHFAKLSANVIRVAVNRRF